MDALVSVFRFLGNLHTGTNWDTGVGGVFNEIADWLEGLDKEEK